MIRTLKSYQQNLKLQKRTELDAFVPVKKTEDKIDKLFLGISLRYQVLSEKTAFLVTSNDQNETLTGVNIPNLESVDYYKADTNPSKRGSNLVGGFKLSGSCMKRMAFNSPAIRGYGGLSGGPGKPDDMV